MNEDYCYDDQFSDLSGWLCKISGTLEEIENQLKFNKNPIGITQSGEHVYLLEKNSPPKNKKAMRKKPIVNSVQEIDCFDEMKYMIYAGKLYYPKGGFNDLKGFASSLEMAVELCEQDAEKRAFVWIQIVNMETLGIEREALLKQNFDTKEFYLVWYA